jgi:pimeloyl-ACP methyl ester carboxylesterase
VTNIANSKDTISVSASAEFQIANAAYNRDIDDEVRAMVRVGIAMGEVVIADNTVTGAGIVLAQRLEQLAEPGGVCIQDAAYQTIPKRLPFKYNNLGERDLKGFSESVRAYELLLEGGDPSSASQQKELVQEVHLHTTKDGVSLAYSSIGTGLPLVKTANWMNHLEYEIGNPPWQHWWESLSAEHRLIRYDQRGNGLSDWDVDNLSFENFVDDIESLVDAMGLEQFALLGISQGCGVSVAYAVRHPERVSHLILYGGYAQGWCNRGPEERRQGEAFKTLIEQGWGQENPAFRQLFASMFMPEASPEEMDAFNAMQRLSVSAENAARLHDCFGDTDVVELLPQVTVPTLVLHCREDARAPFSQGRTFAARIPNAKFVPLEGRNHILLPGDPAWKRFQKEVSDFCRT